MDEEMDEGMTNEQSEQLMILSRLHELGLIREMINDGKSVTEAIEERKKELNEQLQNTMR
jgi:hypothetical protein